MYTKLRNSLIAVLFVIGVYGQEYNSWSLELNSGVYKTTVGTADNYHNYVGTPILVDIGLTHFVTPSFGVKTSFGYQNLKANRHNNSFTTDYLRGSLLGVWNADKAFDFDKWYGLQLDLGFGYTLFYPHHNQALKSREKAGHIMGTLTNKIKLSKNLKFLASIELISHYNMNITFDGTQSTGDPLDATIGRNTGISDGTIYNFKLGISYSWNTREKKNSIEERLENKINIALSNIKQGDTIIKNYYTHQHFHQYKSDPYDGKVFFEFDKHDIGIAQANVLDRIYLKMKDNPEHKLLIVGYADYRGSEEYNQILAQQRAYEVFLFLINAGIHPERLSYTSNGERPDFSASEPTTQLDRVVYFIKQ